MSVRVFEYEGLSAADVTRMQRGAESDRFHEIEVRITQQSDGTFHVTVIQRDLEFGEFDDTLFGCLGYSCGV